ncbi:hypothetical protein [Anaplasma centrale]|nr:hypothetical protein [Anaplasma centrale]
MTKRDTASVTKLTRYEGLLQEAQDTLKEYGDVPQGAAREHGNAKQSCSMTHSSKAKIAMSIASIVLIVYLGLSFYFAETELSEAGFTAVMTVNILVMVYALACIYTYGAVTSARYERFVSIVDDLVTQARASQAIAQKAPEMAQDALRQNLRSDSSAVSPSAPAHSMLPGHTDVGSSQQQLSFPSSLPQPGFLAFPAGAQYPSSSVQQPAAPCTYNEPPVGDLLGVASLFTFSQPQQPLPPQPGFLAFPAGAQYPSSSVQQPAAWAANTGNTSQQMSTFFGL